MADNLHNIMKFHDIVEGEDPDWSECGQACYEQIPFPSGTLVPAGILGEGKWADRTTLIAIHAGTRFWRKNVTLAAYGPPQRYKMCPELQEIIDRWFATRGG
jgi:hypothetical protein